MKKINGLYELIQVGEQLSKDGTIQNILSDLEKIRLERLSCINKKTRNELYKTFMTKEKELGEYLKNNSLLPSLSYDYKLLHELKSANSVDRKLALLLANILVENFGDEKSEDFFWDIICFSVQGTFHVSLAISNQLYEHAKHVKKRRLDHGKSIKIA